ncbi:MAG: hypothetical protein ACI9WU_001256, partial [Myxococcota bacterium]
VGLVAWSLSAQAAVPTHSASWTDAPPIVDGRLTDQAWVTAKRAGDFRERKPSLRARPADKTSFAVLYDANAIYFAIWMEDSQPDNILGLTRGRDIFNIFRDDAISLKIDAASDQRTTHGFAINPAGSRLDYTAVLDGPFKAEFDAVWQGVATQDDRGWTAEFRIPWVALGVDPSQPLSGIGLNLSRDHPRRNATYDWSLMPPPYSPVSANLYGKIQGFDRLGPELDVAPQAASDKSWSLTPYVLGGFRKPADAGFDEVFNAGADISAELGAGWRGHLTVNTDFAQVDLDDQVVNLDRFGLFLPEKRDFFLEEDSLFVFGHSGSSQMLHTRRIGLSSGREVPILAGMQVVGRPAEALRVGLLEVTTRGLEEKPWTSHLVGRALLEFGGGSNVGFMVTHRQAHDAADDRNTVFGLDGAWRGPRSSPLLLEVFALTSLTGDDAAEPEGATGAADTEAPEAGVSVSLEWRDELIRPALSYEFYGGGLRTDLGFFRRVDIHRTGGKLTVEPRIGKAGLEKINTYVGGVAIADGKFDEILDWNANGGADVIWDIGYRAGFDVEYGEETVISGFTVGDDTRIDAGTYQGVDASFSFSSPSQYKVSGSLTLGYQDYFGGTLWSADSSLSVRPSTLLRLSLSGSFARAEFDGKPSFSSGLVNGRVTLGFTNDLSWSVFGGWNHLLDRLQFHSRIRFSYLPGSDLFLVYQVDMDAQALTPSFQTLLVKATVRY